MISLESLWPIYPPSSWRQAREAVWNVKERFSGNFDSVPASFQERSKVLLLALDKPVTLLGLGDRKEWLFLLISTVWGYADELSFFGLKILHPKMCFRSINVA